MIFTLISLQLIDEQLWKFNKDTLALINARTGTAIKVTETREDGRNQTVDGKWIIPDENTLDIVETAFQVLGLSLDNSQLWTNDSTGIKNKEKTSLDFTTLFYGNLTMQTAINWTFPSGGVAGVIRNENEKKVLQVNQGKQKIMKVVITVR